MLVMHVRRMRMAVRPLFMTMKVVVLTGEGRMVNMIVVAIVMTVSVIVLDHMVGVQMKVLLGQMQIHADAKEDRCTERRPIGRPAAHRPGGAGASEGSNGKDRSGSTCAHRSLCEKVQAKAKTVADGSAEKEGGGRRRRRESLLENQRQSKAGRCSEPSFPSNDLGRIEIGQWPSEGVVQGPPERGEDDCESAESNARLVSVLTCHEARAAENHQCHGDRDSPTDVLFKK
jgi:hypothetical protein